MRRSHRGLGREPARARGRPWAEKLLAPISGEPARIDLRQWDYGELYKSGWRAGSLIGADVIGKAGEEIGNVENIMIGPDGKVLSIIAEIGGFLDIGDTHVNIPWKEVQFTSGQESGKGAPGGGQP